MLKHVVRDWLARVRDERDVDAALIGYLGSAGFRDVHFTHGPGEIGKDFIAKQDGPTGTVQYAIQSKSGNIATSDWRSIREQMWEAVRMGLPHPAFSSDLPCQGVLVLTGELVGGAKVELDLFNEALLGEGRLAIKVWHNEELCRRFTDLDSTIVYPADKIGYAGFGSFYTAYGEALDGKFDPREFERHSRFWLAEVYGPGHLLLPAVEGSVVATAAESVGDRYGAFQARLALVRAASDAALSAESSTQRAFFDATVARAIDGAVAAAERFCADVWAHRESTRDRKLLDVVRVAPIITYPVLCFRLCEALAFVYVASTDEKTRTTALCRLRKIVVTEEGVKHPVGDRYAVSVVAIIRALLAGGEPAVARSYLRETAYWVLNLYANRAGLASVDDDENGEVDRLFGPDIPSMRTTERKNSFMVTALLDVCAYAEDRALYSDIENDLRHFGLLPEYWSAPDTRDQFRLDGADVVRFPNVVFEPTFVGQPRFGYGQHLAAEPRAFALAERLGQVPHLAASLLLRDRYFPTTWGAWQPAQATTF